jgi:sulfonate transport system permease protein
MVRDMTGVRAQKEGDAMLAAPTRAGAASLDGAIGGGRVVHRRPELKERTPRKYRIRRRRLEIGLGIIVPVCLVGLWQLLVSEGVLTRKFFPAPSDLYSTGVNLWSSGTMEGLIGDSARRVLEGFFMGVVAGLIFGVLLGLSQIARAALTPTIYALWTIPTIALLPLFLYFFGLSTMPVILLIAITCMFLTLIPSMAAVSHVPEAYQEAASSFGANRRQMLRYVVLPAALPQIVISLRVAAGASVLVMVAGEFLDGKAGVGFFIFNSYQLFDVKQMYVGIVTVAVLGALWMIIVAGIGQRLTRWQRAG